MTVATALALRSDRELLVDHHLIDVLEGASLRLHHPVPREVVLKTDRPWEGNMNAFNTLIEVDGVYRLYYRGWQVDLQAKSDAEGKVVSGLNAAHTPTICMATSSDGRHWARPDLGVAEFAGSRANNIVFQELGWHGFSPFLDTNPDAKPDERFKAVGVNDGAKPISLLTFASPDGIHWRPLLDAPILAGKGDFDSHNLVYWDQRVGRYRCYLRLNRQVDGKRVRDIMTTTSPDLREWDEPVLLQYAGVPYEELYTNNVQAYYRAPQLYVGLPARYVERLPWSPTMDQLPEREHRELRSATSMRYGTAVSDAVLMTSRDGQHFRRWGEAFIRPGLRTVGSWTYGDIYPAWGILETVADTPGGEPELSIYASEGYWRGRGSSVRRYSLRVDGFVSLNAPLAGGRMRTKVLTFTGSRLSLNVSTSAAGGMRIGILDAAGAPIPGFGMDDCWEIVGDTLDYTVTWRDGSDLSALAGRPIRLDIQLSDADLYSLQFC